MSPPTLPKVQKLQNTLHTQAKGLPENRFDVLWKEIIILFLLVRKNGTQAIDQGQVSKKDRPIKK